MSILIIDLLCFCLWLADLLYYTIAVLFTHRQKPFWNSLLSRRFSLYQKRPGADISSAPGICHIPALLNGNVFLFRSRLSDLLRNGQLQNTVLITSLNIVFRQTIADIETTAAFTGITLTADVVALLVLLAGPTIPSSTSPLAV